MKLRDTLFDPGGRKRRARTLHRLCAAWPHELVDTSIGGRARIIALLEEANRGQRAIRAEHPEFYRAVFHAEVVNALHREREALAAMTRALPADHPMLQLRLIKD
jgi:hypothetical protein